MPLECRLYAIQAPDKFEYCLFAYYRNYRGLIRLGRSLTDTIRAECVSERTLKYQVFQAFVKRTTHKKLHVFGGGLPYSVGARLNGIQEVRGSSPLRSTKLIIQAGSNI